MAERLTADELADLRRLAMNAIPGDPRDRDAAEGRWEAWFNFHGDPYVVETSRGQFGVVATVSTIPEDYGRDRAWFMGAVDPVTVLALVTEIEQLRAALDQKGFVRYELTEDGWVTTFHEATHQSSALE